MKFHNLFLLLWVIFALLDPDPEYGSESDRAQHYSLFRVPQPWVAGREADVWLGLQEKESLEREQGHEFPGASLGTGKDALFTFYSVNSAGIFKPSMRARNRIGLSHRPARLHSLAAVLWNR